jgi:hypothetical protein
MTTAEQSIVVDTPAGMQAFHLLQLKYALRIEINTGLKMSGGSVMKQVNREYGTSFTRKQAALDFVTGLLDYMNGDAASLPEVPGMEWQI